ncbi:hypothetical protein MBLNU459_g8359t1 [Dothideomycetes sp. NU459]
MPSKKAQERALTLQEREVHKYYQPWLDAQGTSVDVAAHVNNLAEVKDFAIGTLEGSGYTARSPQDKALTAFAQLAALRLNVRRCMVSLIDSTHQYILTEATKTLSLVDDSRHAESDALWLGRTVLSRNDAVCQCVFNRTYTVNDENGNPISGMGAVIPDCRLDPEFEDMPYVLADPGVRFYAGVPIKSRSGHLIGVYAVSNDLPRDPLTADEFLFMQDIALAVFDHLEWARDRVDRYKGERIVRGMAAFTEASTTLRESKIDMEDDPLSPSSPSERDRATHVKQETRVSEPRSNPSLRRSSFLNFAASEQQSSPKSEKKKDSLSRMFDRAAFILRRSTLADGVVFFGPNNKIKTPIVASGDFTTQTTHERFTHSPTPHEESANGSKDSEPAGSLDLAEVVGLSLGRKEEKLRFENSFLSVSTLESYFSLYPHGKSLHFSKQGSSITSVDDSLSANHQELLETLPSLENVVFVPLWDHIHDKVVAGCFLWTSTTGRMMSLDDDISYLRAFGNAIMSEVIRIKARKDDRAKTTFIASMSHELRSPLHGILGNVEFLQDCATDSYQAGLITSIATCGKTLLDTLDHVLDYAKINKLGRIDSQKSRRMSRLSQSSSDINTESIHLIAEIDLGLVVEEVVEAVCAGHAFKQMHTGDLQRHRTHTPNPIKKTTKVGLAHDSGFNNGEVSVLLDISPRASWRVQSQPGALRRIIMNLLGNALKYTSSGFVAVSLRAQESEDHQSIDVVFRVVDSGKGMSDDFQNTRLFVPFSQEDPFQPGTGLGLSIVRQIVHSLGGSIDVESVLNVGTEVDIRLSLPVAEPAITTASDVMPVAETTRGLRVCLLDPNDEKQRKSNEHIERLDTTLREVCYGWFDMEIIKASNMNGTDADIFMYTEPPSVEYLLKHHGVKKEGKSQKCAKTGREVPLIIVCLNSLEAITISNNHIKTLSQLGKIVEVISQPCGPRKLAKVFEICVRRMNERFDKSMQKDQSTSTANAPVEDQGTATIFGLSSNTLPRLSSAEAVDTRKHLRDLSSQIPPSIAVAFPSQPHDKQMADETKNDTKAKSKSESFLQQDLTFRNGPSKEFGAPHVLIVDDNNINLQLLVMFMKKHKFSYAEAENGQEAVDAYIASYTNNSNSSDGRGGGEADQSQPGSKGRVFDYVLMDISMPVMDGLEATRRIRAHERDNALGRVTIIALTGLGSEQAQQDAKVSGVDVFMVKPVNFRALRPLLAGSRGGGSRGKQG